MYASTTNLTYSNVCLGGISERFSLIKIKLDQIKFMLIIIAQTTRQYNEMWLASSARI